MEDQQLGFSHAELYNIKGDYVIQLSLSWRANLQHIILRGGIFTESNRRMIADFILNSSPKLSSKNRGPTLRDITAKSRPKQADDVIEGL
jgi:hypothetical protein